MDTNANLVLTNESTFNKDKEMKKFAKASALFEKLGYAIFIDDNNRLVTTKIHIPNETSITWFIGDCDENGVVLKTFNDAAISFSREKQIDGTYTYNLGLLSLSKFTKEELELIDSTISYTFFHPYNISDKDQCF